MFFKCTDLFDYVEKISRRTGLDFSTLVTNGCYSVVITKTTSGGKKVETVSIGATPKECRHYFELWYQGYTYSKNHR